MKISGKGQLLRIFIGEADRADGINLYEKLIYKAREMGLAGATVLKGIEGYGAASSIIHKAHLLRLSEDLPIIVEIVDQKDRIDEAVKEFDKIINEVNCGVLMTLESVEILHYRPSANSE